MTRAELTQGQPLTTAQAARLVPGTGRRGHVSPATIGRWMTKGQGGVLLDSARFGGRRWTTVEALDSFLAGINQASGGSIANGHGGSEIPHRMHSRERIARTKADARQAVGLKDKE